MEKLMENDREVARILINELYRQRNTIELIASENFASVTVMDAVGSIFTNKYAEGYPNKRYYGGCEFVDRLEELAISRAKELFGADHVNVQPHSGSQANMAVYMAMLNVGDVILGMELSNGGHLTHGSSVNFSGRLYNTISYGVDENGYIDYDEVRKLALTYSPKLIIAGASAYSRVIDFKKFREIADEIGAYLMVDMAHIAGLVATGLHPSPIPYADFVTSTTHKTLRGTRGGLILCKEQYAKKIDNAVFPRIQGGALMHSVAGKAVCFGEALKPEFKEYQGQVIRNAKTLAAELINKGYKIVSGGTDNHLILVDLTNKGLSGLDAEHLLEEVGITVNKNSVPNEKLSPFVTSGIRIGTPAITTRGFVEEDMIIIADLIDKTLNKSCSVKDIKNEVYNLCDKYPLYERY